MLREETSYGKLNKTPAWTKPPEVATEWWRKTLDEKLSRICPSWDQFSCLSVQDAWDSFADVLNSMFSDAFLEVFHGGFITHDVLAQALAHPNSVTICFLIHSTKLI